MVVHAHRVELDRDAALALQVHRVEDLLPHQTLVERARELDGAVGQGRLAVVDVGHDREVADVILAHVGLKYSHPPSIIRRGPTLADDGCERTRYTPRGILLAPITGWLDPTSNGRPVRRAAYRYFPAKGDPGLRRPRPRRLHPGPRDHRPLLAGHAAPPP